MCGHTARNGVEIGYKRYGNALIDQARNKALSLMRPEATHALFVDDDMLMEADSLLRLLAHDLPVVSAYCTTRPPVDLPFKVYDEASHQFVPLFAVKPGELLQGKFALGAAFLLMRRDAIEKLIQFYLTAADWLWFERRTLDRLHVRTEWREKERERREELRRAAFAADGYLRVFDRNLCENERRHGEDIDLSWKLLALGIPTAIDTQTVVGHIGDYPYGPWDLDSKWEGTPEAFRPKTRDGF